MALPAVEVSQTPEEKFREFLSTRPKPLRFTEQRRDLVRFIFESHQHFDADDLIDHLKQAELNISRATIYRTLSQLVEAGLLRRHDVNGRAVYEHEYGYPQHEHFVCETCKRMIEFQHPALDAILREMAGRHQFQISGHTLLVRGTCVECNRKKASKRRLDLI